MNKTTLVAFILSGFSSHASPLMDAINQLESDWALVYYRTSEEQQKRDYPLLLKQAQSIGQQYPHAAEPKIWQAILLSANAAYESPLKALRDIKQAKKLLEQAIAIQPDAMEGSAYVTLGTLYYMVPGWPISFGNPGKADKLLKKALEINPDGIDANYFYGDFLLSQSNWPDAVKFFYAASIAPLRKEQLLADSELRENATIALHKTLTKNVKHRSGHRRYLSSLSTDGYKSFSKASHHY